MSGSGMEKRRVVAMKGLGTGSAVFRLECGHEVIADETSAAWLEAFRYKQPVECWRCSLPTPAKPLKPGDLKS